MQSRNMFVFKYYVIFSMISIILVPAALIPSIGNVRAAVPDGVIPDLPNDPAESNRTATNITEFSSNDAGGSAAGPISGEKPFVEEPKPVEEPSENMTNDIGNDAELKK